MRKRTDERRRRRVECGGGEVAHAFVEKAGHPCAACPHRGEASRATGDADAVLESARGLREAAERVLTGLVLAAAQQQRATEAAEAAAAEERERRRRAEMRWGSAVALWEREEAKAGRLAGALRNVRERISTQAREVADALAIVEFEMRAAGMGVNRPRLVQRQGSCSATVTGVEPSRVRRPLDLERMGEQDVLGITLDGREADDLTGVVVGGSGQEAASVCPGRISILFGGN